MCRSAVAEAPATTPLLVQLWELQGRLRRESELVEELRRHSAQLHRRVHVLEAAAAAPAPSSSMPAAALLPPMLPNSPLDSSDSSLASLGSAASRHRHHRNLSAIPEEGAAPPPQPPQQGARAFHDAVAEPWALLPCSATTVGTQVGMAGREGSGPHMRGH